jgi:hypothetical protein
MHSFIFLCPKGCFRDDGLAERLLRLRRVKRLSICSSSGGCVVRIRFFDGSEPEDAIGYVSRGAGSRIGKIVGDKRGAQTVA